MQIMRRTKKVDSSVDTMILTDCINEIKTGLAEPRVYKIGKKYGVHHNYVRRLWDRYPKEKLAKYEDMMEAVQEVIVERHLESWDELNSKMIQCASKALDIWSERLEHKAYDIADRDLISFISKVVQGSQEKESKPTRNNLIFNIIDQSITTEYNER